MNKIETVLYIISGQQHVFEKSDRHGHSHIFKNLYSFLGQKLILTATDQRLKLLSYAMAKLSFSH